MDIRPEPRFPTDLVVRIWGMSADGHAFFQNVPARNISNAGALLTGLDYNLTAGDVIGVQNGGHKARFKVIWAIQTEPTHQTQIGIQLVEGQDCPWIDKLSPPELAKTSDANKRKFNRLKIHFPIEMTTERAGDSSMRTSATDISGHGCYVESRLPFPIGTSLEIRLWIESEKVITQAVVRTSDPGVGMGIEFIGLPLDFQERFQHILEQQVPESAEAENPETSS